MKKYGIVMITIMLLSMIPAVFAQEDAQELGLNTLKNMEKRARENLETHNEDSEPDSSGKIWRVTRRDADSLEVQNRLRELSKDQMEKLEKLGREDIEAYVAMNKDDLKEKLDSLKVERVKTEDLYRKRVVAKDRLEMAKEKYLQAKSRYMNLKEEYAQKKSEWREAVADGREDAAIEAAKSQVIKAAKMILETIEQAKSQIEANDDLTEVQAEEALLELVEKGEYIGAIITDAKAATTKEEIKAIASELKSAWSRSRYTIHERAEDSVRADVGEILTRSERLEVKMDRILEELADKGTDTSELDDKVDEFSEQITQAKEKFSEANILFAQAKENEDREVFSDAKELVRQAHEDLKEANDILMEIWKKVKRMGYLGNLEEGEETEVVVDEEEDNALNICDHNNDGKRDLTDVSLFAQIKTTFDANNDGKHDLSDVVAYAQEANNQDDEWCSGIVPVAEDGVGEDSDDTSSHDMDDDETDEGDDDSSDDNSDGSRDLEDDLDEDTQMESS